MTVPDERDLLGALREQGYTCVPGLTPSAYRALASKLGHVVANETIELRDGAHAYVAKPGQVPFHTDQAQVEIIGWHCQQQDANDGASLLLDSRPILSNLSVLTRDLLRRVRLSCPPVAGGPPTFSVPVLRQKGDRDAFFCSPWLDPVDCGIAEQDALRMLSSAIQAFAVSSTIRVRLAPGDALFIDNQRIMHGRAALSVDSRRKLHRVWIISRETAEME